MEGPNWSQVCGLELTQVGQQRQLSVLVAALVFPVAAQRENQGFDEGAFWRPSRRPSHTHSRGSLPSYALELRLDSQVGVAPGGVVVICELIQGRLCRRVSLVTWRRPQKLRREGGRLGHPAVLQLHHMGHWEKADHVHQQLKSKPCGGPEATASKFPL